MQDVTLNPLFFMRSKSAGVNFTKGLLLFNEDLILTLLNVAMVLTDVILFIPLYLYQFFYILLNK